MHSGNFLSDIEDNLDIMRLNKYDLVNVAYGFM